MEINLIIIVLINRYCFYFTIKINYKKIYLKIKIITFTKTIKKKTRIHHSFALSENSLKNRRIKGKEK